MIGKYIVFLWSFGISCMIIYMGCSPTPTTALTEDKVVEQLESNKESWHYISGLLVEVELVEKYTSNEPTVILDFDDGRKAILVIDNYCAYVFKIGAVNKIWYDKNYNQIQRIEFETPLEREE